jgi:putative heme iron utilization protein
MGSPAVACRELATRVRFGALATVQRSRGPGEAWPFATLVSVAVDDRGRPLFLLSRLAEHTKNLEQCARSSLLLVEPIASAESLASERMTIVGECAPVPAGEQSAARAAFLAAHPDATQTIDFADFDLWRMEVANVRWVAGFGRMGWIDGDEYLASSAPAAASRP